MFPVAPVVFPKLESEGKPLVLGAGYSVLPVAPFESEGKLDDPLPLKRLPNPLPEELPPSEALGTLPPNVEPVPQPDVEGSVLSFDRSGLAYPDPRLLKLVMG